MRDEVLRWSAQPPEARLEIEDDTYNYTGVFAEIPARAEQETVRIREWTAVPTICWDCPPTSPEAVGNLACALPDATSRLTLRLLTDSMADAFENLPVRLANDLEITGMAHLMASSVYAPPCIVFVFAICTFAPPLPSSQVMRNAFTRVAILVFLGSGARASARSRGESELLLTVRVYDLAQVGADDLHQATERADIIFRQAGIRIRWVVVPPVNEVHEYQDSEEWNSSDLHLRLWPRAGIASNTFSEDTLGFRLSTEKSTAIIIADEVRGRAPLPFANPVELVALVMLQLVCRVGSSEFCVGIFG